METIKVKVETTSRNRYTTELVITTTDFDFKKLTVDPKTLATAMCNSEIEAAMVITAAKNKLDALCMLTVASEMDVQVENNEIIEISHIDFEEFVIDTLTEQAIKSVFE